MLVAVAMIPGLVRNYFRECSEAARFADVDVYLHQMTYSFIRNPKVNMALKDAYAISTGRLKRCLSRAIEELWFYMGPLFANNKKYMKKIKKSEKCAVYESAVAELFASEEAFFDPDNIKVL